MSDGNGNATNGHGAKAAVKRRLKALEPHPFLLGLGFSAAHVDQAGWRVDRLGERHARYGLPEEAAECEVWLIPYRHPNGQVWFERARWVNPEDRARFGGRDPDHRGPSALYDPFLVLGGESFQPCDAVLLVEGEANTVAAEVICAGHPVIGLTPGGTLTPALASYLGHIPLVYLWLEGDRVAALQEAPFLAERLREAGVQEVRRLAGTMSAAEALRELDFDRAVEAANELLRQAETVRERVEDWASTPRPVPPAFPVDALPGTIAEFVRRLSTQYQTAPDLAALTVLGVLAAVGMNAKVDCVNWEEETLGLYILCCSPSGDRKSTILKKVAAPLYRLESEIRQAWEASAAKEDDERTVLEARKKALTRKMEKLESSEDHATTRAEYDEISEQLELLGRPAEAIEPQLLASDATPEGLADLMHQNRDGITVLAAESAVIDNLLGHYSDQGKANLHVVCEAYTADRSSVNRRGRPAIIISRPLLTITLLAQEDVLENVAGHGKARTQGLIARFALVDASPASYVGRRQIKPPPPKVPPHLHEAWDGIVRRVQGAIGTAEPAKPPIEGSSGGFAGFAVAADVGLLTLSLSPSSKELLTEVELAVEPRLDNGADLEFFRDWMSRHHGRIARIAALLHLAERPPSEPIAVDTMRRALRIGEYLFEHAVLTISTPDPLVRRAKEWLAAELLAKGITEVSRRDLHNGPLGKNGKVDQAAKLAAALVDAGVLRPIEEDVRPGPKGGRPKGPRYRINPNLREPTS